MSSRSYLFALVTLITLTFFSCKEAPRNFDSSILGPDQINLVSLDSYVDGLPQSSHSVKTVVNTGTSNTLLLGSYKTSSGNIQDASTLIQFDYSFLSDSVKAWFSDGSITVNDSWITFTKTYAFGDTNATQIDFGVYKINSPWTSSGFTSDSLDNLSYGTDDMSSQKILVNDSLYKVHIKPAVIQEEISNYANGTNDYGIYLKPNQSGNVVWGFGSNLSSYAPTLTIAASKDGVIDTLYFNTLSNVSVLSGNLVTSSQDFYLQPSLMAEAIVSFDVSSIPSNAVINQAQLILTIDTLNSVRGTVYNSEIAAYNVADSVAGTIDSTTTWFTTISESDSATYVADITPFVQSWVREKKNQGILLSPYRGATGLDIYAIKSSNSNNLSQRPRLIIFYTTKK